MFINSYVFRDKKHTSILFPAYSFHDYYHELT